MNFRVGHGYDIHRLREGRKLILGGVVIGHDRGLEGHSDADALVHAVIDALLGAAAMGDIGSHFPDEDPEYEGADSLSLLRSVAGMLKREAWKIGNLDVTVIAQRPRLAPRVPAMRENLAGALGIDENRVSIKAKTNEGVGAVGREEAIAAHAVALVYR